MSVIETLTEGIRARSLANEGEALLGKWEQTGLLEGLDDVTRSNMSRLLENQAAQLLKETSTMAAGDVEGFASVAFPIVRRVFGNLLAQDLVSVQPMSLPSGLIFFLDFQYDGSAAMTTVNGITARLANRSSGSLYGGGVVGQQITGGVDLSNRLGESSFYSLNNGFAGPTGSSVQAVNVDASGTYGDAASSPGGALFDVLRGDPVFVSGALGTGSPYVVLSSAVPAGLNLKDFVAICVSGTEGPDGTLNTGGFQVRRLTEYSGSSTTVLRMVLTSTGEDCNALATSAATLVGIRFPLDDTWSQGGAIGSVMGTAPWQLENNTNLPQIDIKIESVAVTANTKKLKAKWSPELAQDLNAYHNLDAEVELTSILSEQIALEIDQEILADLINGATAGTLYWSRSPGKFLNAETGALLNTTQYPDFTGNVSEWYETCLERVNDVSARIHRKTLRGGANFLVCSPEVANILEFTSGFRASAAVDDDKGSWGVHKVGSISRKMDIHVDPYFPRNLILVGRRGSSFLESGYVYAPYVPLQVTPTIFGPEDFVPRKGVMTRYAKKMVRPDMYGLVVVADLV